MKAIKIIIAALILSALTLPTVVPCFASSYKPYVYGDVTVDEKVNSVDLTRMMKYISYDGEAEISNADLNSDGKINSRDLTRLMKLIAGEKITVEYSDPYAELEAARFDGGILSVPEDAVFRKGDVNALTAALGRLDAAQASRYLGKLVLSSENADGSIFVRSVALKLSYILNDENVIDSLSADFLISEDSLDDSIHFSVCIFDNTIYYTDGGRAMFISVPDLKMIIEDLYGTLPDITSGCQVNDFISALLGYFTVEVFDVGDGTLVYRCVQDADRLGVLLDSKIAELISEITESDGSAEDNLGTGTGAGQNNLIQLPDDGDIMDINSLAADVTISADGTATGIKADTVVLFKLGEKDQKLNVTLEFSLDATGDEVAIVRPISLCGNVVDISISYIYSQGSTLFDYNCIPVEDYLIKYGELCEKFGTERLDEVISNLKQVSLYSSIASIIDKNGEKAPGFDSEYARFCDVFGKGTVDAEIKEIYVWLAYEDANGMFTEHGERVDDFGARYAALVGKYDEDVVSEALSWVGESLCFTLLFECDDDGNLSRTVDYDDYYKTLSESFGNEFIDEYVAFIES